MSKGYIGTSTQYCKNPNRPSIDPAETIPEHVKEISRLHKSKPNLSSWERKFLTDIYCREKLIGRQREILNSILVKNGVFVP